MSGSVRVIEILGSGCARCQEAHRVVQHVVDEARLDCRVEKNTSIDRMVELGVLASPAVVIDGKIVLSERIPGTEEVRRLLGLG